MNLNPLFSGAIKKASNIINYQSVRWRRLRKPFWLGLARSKMFVIPQPKRVITPEEKETIRSLYENYNLQSKSLLNFITNDNPRLKYILAEEETVKSDPALEEKISLSLKVNEEWNAESKRLGEKWMEDFMAKEAEKAEELLEKDKKLQQERQEMIDEIVRREKVLSESFITPENLDEAIEKCLESVEEFDFAIDLQGNRYYGRQTLEKVAEPGDAVESAILAEDSRQQNEVVTEAT